MGVYACTFFALLCIGFTWDTQVQAMSDEKRLTKHLMDHYSNVGKYGRPVESASNNLTVDFSLTLIKLLKIDEARQTISLLAWYKMMWTDFELTWKPEEFDNIKMVRIPASEIWTPDMMPFLELPGEITVKDVLVAVSYDGSVIWVPPVEMTTLCKDLVPGSEKVTCAIKIGSWTFSSVQLDLKEKENYLDVSTYTPNPLWELTETKTERQEKKYDCCEETYLSIVFSLTFERGLSWSSAIVGQALSVPLLLCVQLFSALRWLL